MDFCVKLWGLEGCGATLGTWNLSEISKVEGASAEKAWRASEVHLKLGKLQREGSLKNFYYYYSHSCFVASEYPTTLTSVWEQLSTRAQRTSTTIILTPVLLHLNIT